MAERISGLIGTFFGIPIGKRRNKRISGNLKGFPSGTSEDFESGIFSLMNSRGSKITAPSINAILASADTGTPCEQAALFQSVLEKEPVMAAHIQTRQLAVLSCDWQIRPATAASFESASAKAAEISAILKKAGIYKLLKHLLDALATGYSGSAVIWEEGGAGIREFKYIHPCAWSFDLSGKTIFSSSDGSVSSLEEYHPAQFIFHTHQTMPGLPCRGGLLRSLIWLYFFKHYALRDRARFLERFGIPFLVAKIKKDDFENVESRSQILSSLSRMGSDGVGVTTEGSDINILGPQGGPGSTAFQEWMDYIDDISALAILGQTASSGNASGFSKGQIQENVRQDLIEADCRALMETINNSLVKSLETFLYGTSGEVEFVMKYEPDADLEKKASVMRNVAESLKVFKESGLEVDIEYVKSTFGIPFLENELT
ncbi:MAG: hypothetical protein A2020_16165 [Lentisphaerae bacterium GWF2_45_14]|nr:MAG: hypothetical protein A2020_16165 [Lentisphaerae bacterium GWF2_45_14]